MSVVLAGAFSGCGGTSSDAQPTSTTPPAPALWDPCSIPDDAIRAAGLRTETKRNDLNDTLPPGWKMCQWDALAPWYRITVTSSPTSISAVKSNPQIIGGRDVDIAGKRGFQYRFRHDREGCDVAIEYGNRTVMTSVVTGAAKAEGDSCTEAVSAATKLGNYYG